MKKTKLFVIYFLIAGLSLSYSAVSYINRRNKALEKIANSLTSFKTKPVAYIPKADLKLPSPAPESQPAPVPAEKTEVYETAAKEASSQVMEDESFALPVDGTAITPFSGNRLVLYKTTNDFKTHTGIDFEAETGETVCAVKSGTVSEVTDSTPLGKTVTLDHGDGLVTVYACLSDVTVKTGDAVIKGDALGTLDTAEGREAFLGTHLHFEAIRNGERINPEELFLK